ncbi:alpha/beta fold hydrolase [Pseudomonas sp. EZ-C24]|uniref:alpha/beta fold hydrolase n=1 Tax=Pseudomonas sp. EZ-C24 TaxID=2753617 RepID=UPI00165E071C|nr:alpha/beta hydrolase [Pseudomonas sp. EZ-C24]
MTLQKRNNVNISGSGSATLILSHGFGCDQTMWKLLLPHLASRFRVISYDLVGAGQSDLAAYEPEKYSSLWGYASDLNELIDAYAEGPVILVCHSASAMIGTLAQRQQPGRVAAMVMIGGSPSYIDSGDYAGGFLAEEVDALLEAIDDNYQGWSTTMAPVLMGEPGEPALGEELLSSFKRTDGQIARHFARVIFLADHRADVVGLDTPTLILQCTRDPVVPVAVGKYLNRVLPNSQLSLIEGMGHYPQLSAPSACTAAIDGFLAQLDFDHG